jgi:V/A-type H+-transporting ATPase subunit I
VEILEKEGLEPPTRLANPWFLKPFEFLVTNFGNPGYQEMDPTPIFSVLYVVMYGAMFGDIGQGFVLICIGILALMIKKLKSMHSLAGVMVYIGMSSVFFGFLYGEIFGHETSKIFGAGLKALWMSPIDNVLPILMIAVVFGAGVICLAILLSMFNSIREKNYGRLLFSPNGMAGLTFYGVFLYIGFCILNGKTYPSWVYFILIFDGLLIMFEKLLERLLFKHHGADSEPFSPIVGFVEVFDASFSFLTNTISFIRIGAFAISHSALMSVVFILAGDPNASPIGYWIAILIGNMFVIGMEGFIVAVQALRLNYYEFFFKFFRANGKPFEPLGIYKTS